MTTIASITSGQAKQIGRMGGDAVETAIKEMGLNQEGGQRVIEHGDVFKSRVREATKAALRELSHANQFAHEEVPSTYGYLSGYNEQMSVAEQVAILRQHFSVQLGQADPWVSKEVALPEGAEGWFAIPRWQTLAPGYNQAVELVLEVLKKACKGNFENFCKGQLGSDRLRETDSKRLAFERVSEAQSGHDVLVVAAQFGIRHRGRSVRRAREVFAVSEFGLGAYEVGIMLLTYPERFQHNDDLWIDCAGDEYADDGVTFDSAPYFFYHDDRINFDAGFVHDAVEFCGSPSAFLPM